MIPEPNTSTPRMKTARPHPPPPPVTARPTPAPAPAKAANDFRRRNWTKAAVSVHPGSPPMLVKDYSRCILPARWIGRLFIAIETRALTRLEGVRGIPQKVRRTGPYTLTMEYIAARPLSELEHAGKLPPEFARRLAALFEEIEQRGVAHGDPHFSNILCDADGNPFLVDFAFAYIRGAVPLLDRWLFRNLQAVREHRILKLRRVFYGEAVSDVPRTGGRFYRAIVALKKTYKRLKKFRKRTLRHHGTGQKIP